MAAGAVKSSMQGWNWVFLNNDEQTRGIQEVNRAVAQLDEMVQQNAALVEESTAAASTLQSQANDLANAVGQFKID